MLCFLMDGSGQKNTPHRVTEIYRSVHRIFSGSGEIINMAPRGFFTECHVVSQLSPHWIDWIKEIFHFGKLCRVAL